MYIDIPVGHVTQTLIYIYIWVLHDADAYVAYLTFMYQVLVSCSSEIMLVISRGQKQVATSYKYLHLQ